MPRVPYGNGYDPYGGGGAGGGVRVGWSEDRRSAYLYDEGNNVIGRWIAGRPDISTFDPFTYGYGQGQSAQGGSIYDVWSRGSGYGYGDDPYGGGDAGGYYNDPDRMAWDEYVRQFNLTHEESVALREQYQRHHDEQMAFNQRQLEQAMEIAKMQIASTEGMQKYEWEQRFKQLEQEHQYAVEYLQMDWAEKHKALDKELGMRLREIQGRERITAAETWARPFDYLAYNRWMMGEQAATTESGLPVGAPGWQTGIPEEATVGAGAVATGGADPYGQQLAAGGRIQEFGAWGGPTGPVGGTPWVSPHKANVAEFSRMPLQAQEMQYARWRQRGIMPGTAQQAMYAAAPVGTAPAQVRYG